MLTQEKAVMNSERYAFTDKHVESNNREKTVPRDDSLKHLKANVKYLLETVCFNIQYTALWLQY